MGIAFIAPLFQIHQAIRNLLTRKPKLLLLGSGYTDDKSKGATIRGKGFRFIQKPYSLADLIGAVREAKSQDHS